MHQRKRNRAGRFFVQLAIIVLAISIIILYILCLTGSTYTSPRIPQIFLAQAQKSSTLISVGFYGICTDPSLPFQICTKTINRSADTIAATLFPNQNQTTSTNTASLINFALDLQQKILFSPLPIAAGLFLMSLPFTLLTRMIAKGRRHLIPGRRLYHLKNFTLSLVWMSTSLALTTAILVMEMVNGLQYVLGTSGNGNMNMTTGGLLQVLLWVIAWISVIFSMAVVGILRHASGGDDGEGDRRIDFERGWSEFEDDHIFTF